jgi:hypothetical protein
LEQKINVNIGAESGAESTLALAESGYVDLPGPPTIEYSSLFSVVLRFGKGIVKTTIVCHTTVIIITLKSFIVKAPDERQSRYEAYTLCNKVFLCCNVRFVTIS